MQYRFALDADHSAERDGQSGPVYRVYVKSLRAALDKVVNLPGGDQPMRLRIALQPVEPVSEPPRHRRAATLRKRGHPPEVMNGENSRNDRDKNPGPTHALDITFIGIVVEKILRDRADRAGINLAPQHFDIRRIVRAIRMLFRIGGHGNVEIADSPATGSAAFS